MSVSGEVWRKILRPLKWAGLALLIIGIAALLLWLVALYDSGVTQ